MFKIGANFVAMLLVFRYNYPVGDKVRSYSIECRMHMLCRSPTQLGVPPMRYFSLVCYQTYHFTRSPFRPQRDPPRQDSHLFSSSMVRSFGCLPFNDTLAKNRSPLVCTPSSKYAPTPKYCKIVHISVNGKHA